MSRKPLVDVDRKMQGLSSWIGNEVMRAVLEDVVTKYEAALDGARKAEVLKLRADNADLLAACEGALAMLDELFPLDMPALIAENRARLQAAIAKAKGDT